MSDLNKINDEVLMQFHKSASEILPGRLDAYAQAIRDLKLPRSELVAEILETAADCMMVGDGYEHACALASGFGYSDLALQKLLGAARDAIAENDVRDKRAANMVLDE